MGKVIYTKRFASPPDRVFAAMADLDRWPEMISGITAVERVTDGPVGVGTRFRETRKMLGKEHTEEMEFTAFEPGKGYTIGCASCGCEMSFVHRFTADGGGTHFELEADTRPVTLFAKITAPIMGAMMKGSMCKAMDQDFSDVERFIEGTGSPGPAPA